MSYTTEHLLTQEQLKKWYNANIAYLNKPRKENIVMTEEDYRNEKERISYERTVQYFERDRDDYIRSDERAYSNPISL